MNKTALITGITGQDGFYLTELLLNKDNVVYGTTRNTNAPATQNLISSLRQSVDATGFEERLQIREIDLLNRLAVERIIAEVQPDEVYHLAGQSRVGRSFEFPRETYQANVTTTQHLLDAIHLTSADRSKIFLAGSGEIFGGTPDGPSHEMTPYAPPSPYARSKLSAQLLVETYREAFGLFACTGILFNHESPRRSEDFVTGKIAHSVARIARGEQQELVLGNLAIGRDWAFARDHVKAMKLMLHAETPQDYVIATGVWRPLTEFLDVAFKVVGLDWRDYTSSDESLFRPSDPIKLFGDSSKIKNELGWQPETPFEELVEMMVKQALLSR